MAGVVDSLPSRRSGPDRLQVVNQPVHAHAPAGRPFVEGEPEAIAETMAALSTASRLRILYGLLAAERTVDDLAEAVGLSSGLVSQQLRVLRLNGMVVGRKSGRHVTYRLADHVDELLVAVRAHADHAQPAS